MAIAYGQPQARVILSLLEWNGIPDYAANIETVRVNPTWTLALGGIPIRVHRDYSEETRTLLDEAADREHPDRDARSSAKAPWRLAYRVPLALTQLACDVAPPPRISAEIVRQGPIRPPPPRSHRRADMRDG